MSEPTPAEISEINRLHAEIMKGVKTTMDRLVEIEDDDECEQVIALLQPDMELFLGSQVQVLLQDVRDRRSERKFSNPN